MIPIWGYSYAGGTEECRDAVEFFASKCGIFLDYVYSGKAAAGVLDYLKTGRFPSGSSILLSIPVEH